jgi:hypothetical protein
LLVCGLVSLQQPDLIRGIHAGAPNPTPHKHEFIGDRIGALPIFPAGLFELGMKERRHALVGVKVQNPVVPEGNVRHSPVSLIGECVELSVKNRNAPFGGDRGRGVGAPRVEYGNIIAAGKGVEASREIGRLVVCENQGRVWHLA